MPQVAKKKFSPAVGRKYTIHREGEPDLTNDDVLDLKNYVYHAIGAILMFELQIAHLKEFAFFPEVNRARLSKQGAIEAIFPLHSTAFTRCISEKRKGHILGFRPVRKNFRMVTRILTYLNERSLPFDVPSVRDALGDLRWPGKKAAPILTWLGNVVSSPKLIEFAHKIEISSFVPGGLETLFEKEDEPKKAPFPPCFIYTAVEDSMQHAHLEVQMKAAAVHSFEVGCRLGNLEKAIGVRVVEPQPNMQYPPQKIPLDSLEARNYSLPIADIQLPRVKTSLHDGAGHSFSIPLVDSRRRSMTTAYSHLAERVEAMRAEGLAGIALKCQNQTGFTRYAALWHKKPFEDWTDDERSNALDGLRGFLEAPPAVPWKVAKSMDLIRIYRAFAYEAQHRQLLLPIDQRSRHLTPEYPITAITGHSARRGYATVLYQAGIDVLAINKVMGWAQNTQTRMLAAYDANAAGTEVQARLQANMLIGAPTYAAPLPGEIFETDIKFPTWKEWLFARLHPDQQDRINMRRRQLNRQESHSHDEEATPKKKVKFAAVDPPPPKPGTMQAYFQPRQSVKHGVQLSMMSVEQATQELEDQLAAQRAAAARSRSRSRSPRRAAPPDASAAEEDASGSEEF